MEPATTPSRLNTVVDDFWRLGSIVESLLGILLSFSR